MAECSGDYIKLSRISCKKNRKEGYERPSHPIIATGTETIESALKKFEENHVHRIFVVDDHKKPIGIVTLKDILLEIINVESIL